MYEVPFGNDGPHKYGIKHRLRWDDSRDVILLDTGFQVLNQDDQGRIGS